MNKYFTFLLLTFYSCFAYANSFDDGNTAFNKKDYTTAMKLWRSLAEKGNADAQINLGVLYNQGLGVKKDHKQAMVWFRKAAKQGNDVAQYYIGIRYQKGEGVKQDDAIAANWYIKAVNSGNPNALKPLQLLIMDKKISFGKRKKKIKPDSPYPELTLEMSNHTYTSTTRDKSTETTIAELVSVLPLAVRVQYVYNVNGTYTGVLVKKGKISRPKIPDTIKSKVQKSVTDIEIDPARVWGEKQMNIVVSSTYGAIPTRVGLDQDRGLFTNYIDFKSALRAGRVIRINLGLSSMFAYYPVKTDFGIEHMVKQQIVYSFNEHARIEWDYENDRPQWYGINYRIMPFENLQEKDQEFIDQLEDKTLFSQ